jgi:DNA-binding MarR family transcriptional regulator
VLQAKDYSALASFRHAMRKFSRFSKELLAGANLTPEQYEALLAIKSRACENELNIRDVSEHLQVRHHSAVNLINKLVASKMVIKRQSARDRREVEIKLTTRGNTILRRLATIHRREMRARSREMIEALQRLRK